MTRPIKFRAWDKERKFMLRVTQIMFGTPNNLIQGLHDREAFLENSTQLELMQFTGLIDKNGKEIYEGDIVKFKHSPYPEDCVEQVRMQEGAWRPMVTNCVHCKESNTYDEVIGNIYETPELLK